MDLEYDRKFEEMKQYIPFLESMIKKLENTTGGATNPRQAQLDKIRSLRDLLHVKKKRMKMENLLKCEQVLVNLYAKVEQRDTLPGIKKASDPLFPSNSNTQEKSNLNEARSKLKSLIITKETQEDPDPDTLPDISRASKIDFNCLPGSKEPALFQRRPYKLPTPPPPPVISKGSNKSPPKSGPKRNYTRRLVSPEPYRDRKSNSDKKENFTRRLGSSSDHKKERKGSSGKKNSKELITLNVPSNSLNSFNTDNILSRIINCTDGDVDIDTLRDLRKQILGELKHTSASDDITDLLIKSYGKKKGKPDKGIISKPKTDVEEGELSDSESEAIENIYGSLVVVDKDNSSTSNCEVKVTNKQEPEQRKIHICLVFNSDKEKTDDSVKADKPIEIEDFQMFGDKEKPRIVEALEQDNIPKTKEVHEIIDEIILSTEVASEGKNVDTSISIEENIDTVPDKSTSGLSNANFYRAISESKDESEDKECTIKPSENTKDLLIEPDIIVSCNEASILPEEEKSKVSKDEYKIRIEEKPVEIPLLNTEPIIPVPPEDKKVVSEIDILQALKNDILSDSIAIPGTNTGTPALHQPKLTKVSNPQEIKKKRISIEKYKEKSTSSPKAQTLLNEGLSLISKDLIKKQSLKLTEKECERFKSVLEYSSDEENDLSASSPLDIYSNLAPKSPENEEIEKVEAPVIIPTDPVKIVASSNSDVDMRTMLLSPPQPVPPPNFNDLSTDTPSIEKYSGTYRPPPVDPRLRRDFNRVGSLDSPNSVNSDKIPPLMSLNRTCLTPNARAFEMTPSRQGFEMTPSRQNYGTDDDKHLNHVYAPMFSPNDSRDQREASSRRDSIDNWEAVRSSEGHWDQTRNQSLKWNELNNREISSQRELMSESSRFDKFLADAQLEAPRTPIHNFGRAECPSTPLPSFGRDPPRTPVHPFGRGDITPLNCNRLYSATDVPLTPSHPFGRSDTHTTPSHPFGRSEPPTTPSNAFGRSEAPITSSHRFGLSDAHQSFSRKDVPRTPIHPFVRSEYSHGNSKSCTTYSKDPRLRDRNTEYEYRRHTQDYDKDRNYVKNKNTENYKDSYLPYNPDNGGERYDKERRYDASSSRRELSVGGTMSQDNNKRLYNRDRSYGRNDRYKIDNRVFNEQRIEQLSSAVRSDGSPYSDRQDNKVHVTSKSGHSFTIDTSVNRTFQDFLVGKGLQVFEYSSDVRRQRATSVGRSLENESDSVRNVRESSVGRTLIKTNESFEKSNVIKRPNFTRAQSVGRDLCPAKQDRSFHDIKADLESYRDSNIIKEQNMQKRTRAKEQKSQTLHGTENKRQTQPNPTKSSYSPRKNRRDPRMQRCQDQFKQDKHNEDKQRKSHGIVYSSVNIAKGTILSTGYGVKNYKIPKIKRAEEVKVEDDPPVVDKSKETKEKPIKKAALVNQSVKKNHKGKSKTIIHTKDKNRETQIENVKISSRVSRDSIDEVENIRTRRKKRIVLSDSDSDNNESSDSEKITNSKSVCTAIIEQGVPIKTIVDEASVASEVLADKSGNKETLIDPASMTNVKVLVESEVSTANIVLDASVKEREDKDDTDILNSSFGLDDLFPENLPVMKNINSLIEDLENDISKTDRNSDTFSDDISLEKMLKDICYSGEKTSEDHLDDLNEALGSTANIVEKAPSPIKKQVQIVKENIVDEKSTDTVSSKTTDPNEQNDHSSDIVNSTPIELTTHDIDSTTGAKKQSHAAEEDVTNIKPSESEVSQSELNDYGRSSTPDSTMLVAQVTKVNDGKSLPDSTSTHDTEPKNVPDTETTHGETENELSKIEDLLSILQDKSKIKKLLNMLCESENEKIKKKLEQLSEIATDEDINDVPTVEPKQNEQPKQNEEPKQAEEPDKVTVTVVDKDVELPLGSSDKVETKPIEDGEIEKAVNTKLDSTPEYPCQPEETAKGKKSTKKFKKVKKTIQKGRRITRSAIKDKPKVNRELKKLQDDIKEMFIKDDVLNATGLRMCRIAKLVTEKNQDTDEDEQQVPKVVLRKFKAPELDVLSEKKKRKPGPKSKSQKNTEEVSETKAPEKHIAMPKTKKLNEPARDPYEFERDSVTDTNEDDEDEDISSSFDSDSESFQSSESMETLSVPKKKPKRKRGRGWQAGFIQKKKRKLETRTPEPSVEISVAKPVNNITNTDCFTDRSYCFAKSVTKYNCRMCDYSGKEIVHHYKQAHPHSEVPLSRMHPAVAKQAIDQCEKVNFQSISKVPSEKYVCRFCYKQIKKRQKGNLESFFWHIVSNHTGEYKQGCSECVNDNQCPFHLHIPSPPKDVQGQLIGYICGKCNFTQISLENLKTHVIVRHNDEQTAVYTINLAVMTKKTLNTFIKQMNMKPRVLRSSRSRPSITEASDDPSDTERSSVSEMDTPKKEIPKMPASPVRSPRKKLRSKINFETEDTLTKLSYINSQNSERTMKTEKEYSENEPLCLSESFEPISVTKETVAVNETAAAGPTTDLSKPSDDIIDYPHFKIRYTGTGAEEYVCCINGNDNHFKTSLIIQMKRHVQMKHTENWDGYCYVCKVIVTTQGSHTFKEYFQHLIDKHRDEFPILECEQSELTLPVVDELPIPEQPLPEVPTPEPPVEPESVNIVHKPYINVRPLSELLSNISNPPEEDNTITLPIIQSVVSLNSNSLPVPPPVPSPSLPNPEPVVTQTESVHKYEETQQEVMSKKHRVVLDTMMCKKVLVKIFKCAGCYCSFSTDSVDEALVHASNHERLGGENSLICAYCDFDCGGNSIDLVTHVFNTHGLCQYACGHCFYRAVASQLVRAHMLRAHGEEIAKEPVLMSTTAPTGKEDVTDMLNRQKAVLYYICADEESNCKFKTFTQGKFTEHLAKHQSSTYKCYYCSQVCPDPPTLCEHMKSHGIKLFQCTWCVHGADNEADLLDHASMRHPTKQPQAYLRVIISKDNSAKRMVLPLAQYNTAVVPTETVAPCNKIQDPRREVERSMSLEELVSSKSITIKPMPQQNEPQPIETIEPPVIDSVEEDSPIPADILKILEAALPVPPQIATPPESISKRTPPPSTAKLTPPPPASNLTPPPAFDLTPPPSTTNLTPLPSTSKTEQVKVTTHDSKTQPQVVTQAKVSSMCPEIVCLDSDDDEAPPPTVVDLNSSQEPLKEPAGFLYNCSVCDITFTRLDSLKAYLKEKHPEIKDVSPSATKNKVGFTCHYCSVVIKPPMGILKRHMKAIHKVTHFIIATPIDTPVEVPVTRKRKRSLETIDRAPKRKFYSPQEVDSLPMKPILDETVYCSVCSFSCKVRTNMVRHLKKHAEMEPVAQSVPVNPVPHLETNEMHFDKMLNLASSSIANRAPERAARVEVSQSTAVPPELLARCPKFVPEKQRYACGATGCNYISVDESMLKCHWKTLHAGATDYHCVHCPPHQHLVPSVPLTAARVIAHLKMHDARLYGCSTCAHYYHYKLEMLEKHILEVHSGSGKVLVVRQEGGSAPAAAAPTMDLKAWNCGLCNYKNMLRQTVAEHCAKNHNSKMQFKCPNCPFRTSSIETLTKHRSNSHPASTDEVIYYYYREGSIPDEADGTPRWMKQRQVLGLDDVKPEVGETLTSQETAPAVALPPVSLNIVKQEVEEDVELTVDELCKHYGQVCEPNGLKYKCPLCKIVMEDSKDAMQSHLYEELQYRKWGCSICSYKAFHKRGFSEHMTTEHRQNRDPVVLPLKRDVETWVAHLLDHQEAQIQKTKENFAKQRIISEKRIEQTPAPVIATTSTNAWIDKTKELQDAFGPFGEARENEFCCPKCDLRVKDEAQMKTHLELELNKIRWRCNLCSARYQDYHEVLSHARGHSEAKGRPHARPVEAPRDPAMRAAWVTAAVQAQRPSVAEQTDRGALPAEDSLLVVRYQEEVPTPELTPGAGTSRRKKTSPTSPDSDDERLVIDEPLDEEQLDGEPSLKNQCPYCAFASKHDIRFHVLRHYDLKPYKCSLCDFTGHKKTLNRHTMVEHSGRRAKPILVKIPSTPPTHVMLDQSRRRPSAQEPEPVEVVGEPPKDVCLVCEKTVSDAEKRSHTHGNVVPEFAKKGDVVVKCCSCLALFADVVTLQNHNTVAHPTLNLNYAYFKLHYDTRDILYCGYCDKKFKFIRDMRSHHNAVHGSLMIKYTSKPYHGHLDLSENDTEVVLKRSNTDADLPPPKRVARKSTTKLPNQAVAKKSTTKLPFATSEYSYYGTKPTPIDNYSKVTTLMEICNKMVKVTMKNFGEILNIEPKVVVKDMNK